jgi:hypothetical protein
MEGQVWGLGAEGPDEFRQTSVDDTIGFFGATVGFIYQR